MVATAAKQYWSNTWRDVQSLGIPALTFIFTQLIGGLPLLVYGLAHWHSDDPFRYASFLTVAICRLRSQSAVARHQGHDVGEFSLYPCRNP